MPVSKDGNAEMVILPVPLTLLSAISSLRVSIPSDLRPADAKRATLLTLKVQCTQEQLQSKELRHNQLNCKIGHQPDERCLQVFKSIWSYVALFCCSCSRIL